MSSPEVPTPPPPSVPPVVPEVERMASVLSTFAVQARRTNLHRVDDLRARLRQASAGGLNADGWSAAERTAHQLAGSAGTFGYATASDLARQLEILLAALGHGGSSAVDPERLSEASRLLDLLSEQLAVEPDLG